MRKTLLHSLSVLLLCLAVVCNGSPQCNGIPQAGGVPLQPQSTLLREGVHGRILFRQNKVCAYAAVLMDLANGGEGEDASGTFQTRTLRGTVSVRWRRRWETLVKDESGRPAPLEFARHPVYSLTIDSPRFMPVRLHTREYRVDALYLNERRVPHGRLRLKGTPEDGSSTPQEHMVLDLPGGRSLVVLRMGVFWVE